MRKWQRLGINGIAMGSLLLFAPVTTANAQVAPPVATYADIADLADSARVVVKAKVRKMARVDPARAANVPPGRARHYMEARTISLITAGAPIAANLRYLADLPLDARGKPPKLKNATVLLFGHTVPGNAAELQLVSPDAQLPWSQHSESMLREILYELVAPDAPKAITGVREAIHVPGTLRGEGETQIFLATSDGSAASLSIRHRPGEPPKWGVSFSEVTAELGNPPLPNTLTWYRLACFLPNRLPSGANHSESRESRAQAEADYRMVLGELGECPRLRG
ncbi:MAG: hypothetical protein M0R03_05575 [Novosphingobium sp.]|nr:hypothetical protein [Novosphingobium sp.]